MAGEDVLIGFILGIVLLGVFNPWKGMWFTIRELRGQVEFLRNGGAERGSEFPNRKEDS